MLLPELGGSWLLPPRDFPHFNESHPMDHDSISSGHTEYHARPYWPAMQAVSPTRALLGVIVAMVGA